MHAFFRRSGLVLACGTALCLSAPAWAQKLSLAETVSASVAQNEMTSRLFVEHSGESLPELNRRVAQVLRKALATREAGVVVAAEGLRTQPVYDRNGRTNRYTVRAVVSVKGTDLEAVSAVTERLASFMGFESVRFSVAPEQVRSVRVALSEQAAKSFMQRAQGMAKALGYKEARLLEGSLDGAHEVRPPVTPYAGKMRAMAMSAESVDMGLQQGAGEEQLSVTFSGTVELVR